MRKTNFKFGREPIIVVVFFALFLIYGFIVCSDYSISVDEIMERNSSLVTYKYIFPGVSDIVTDSVDFTEVSDLLKWRDRYYGVALQLPAVAVEHMFQFCLPLKDVLQIRHYYVFLLSFIAACFFYKLAKKITGNIYTAILGTMFFILYPRTLADSFYNIKDSVFLSVFTVNLYCAALFLEKQNWKRMLLLAGITAFCVNTRIVGAVAIAVCLLLVFIKNIRQHTLRKKWALILGAGCLSILFYVLITPVTWHDPLKEIINVYRTFSDYTAWEGTNFYLGRYYDASQLPWHYLPVWMLITLPLITVTFAGIGVIHCLRIKKQSYFGWMLLVTIAVPILYVIAARPVLYNGWRHFYFVYAAIALMAVFGVQSLRSLFHANRWKRVVDAGLIVTAILAVARVWDWHPYEYAYFNPVAANYADKYFEKDYWGMTTNELLEDLLKNDKSEKLDVYLHMGWAANKLSVSQRERLHLMGSSKGAVYTTYQPTASQESAVHNPYYFYPKEYIVEKHGIGLSALYYSQWDEYSYSIVEEASGSDVLTYNLNGISWDKMINGSSAVLHGSLSIPIYTSKLALETVSSYLAVKTQVYIDDGSGNWISLDQSARRQLDDGIIHYYMDELVGICGIKIVYPENGKENVWKINLYRRLYEQNSVDYSDNSPFEVVAASSQSPENPAEYAIDNNNETSWTAGYQEEGMVFAFTMKTPHTLSKIAMNLEEEWYNYPEHLRIFVSADEQEWTELDVSTEDNVIFSFAPVECRYVRMVLGPVADQTENHWSIWELLLYETK